MKSQLIDINMGKIKKSGVDFFRLSVDFDTHENKETFKTVIKSFGFGSVAKFAKSVVDGNAVAISKMDHEDLERYRNQ